MSTHEGVRKERFDVSNAHSVYGQAESDFLTVEGLAELLRVPVRTIYTWQHQGTGPRAHRVGRYLRFRRPDVESWLADNVA